MTIDYKKERELDRRLDDLMKDMQSHSEYQLKITKLLAISFMDRKK